MVSLPYHEFLHLWALRALGGDGYIKTTEMFFECVATSPPSNPLIVSMIGGIGCGLTYLLLAFLSHRNKSPENYAALMSIAFLQIFYGIFETIYIGKIPPRVYEVWSERIGLIGAVVGLWLSNYLKKSNHPSF